MSSTLSTDQAETSIHRFYSLWIECVFGHLTNAVESVYNLVVFLNDWTVMFVPYLHYKLYRYDEEDDTYSTEKYSQIIKAHETLWDHYYHFLLQIFPVLFPMVATSGVPLCSSAGFVATMTFTVGAASVLATKIIINAGAGAFKLHHERFISEWLKASQTPWRTVPNKSFWVLLSLPSIDFFLSVGLLISTIILTIWERPVAGITPSLQLQGCSVERWKIFKCTLLATLAVIAAHFTFIFVKLRSMTALQITGIAAAV